MTDELTSRKQLMRSSTFISRGLRVVARFGGGQRAENVWAKKVAGYPAGRLDREHMPRRDRASTADPLIHCLGRDAQKASNPGLAGSQLLDGDGNSVHASILSIALVYGQALLSYNQPFLVGQSSDA